MKLARVRLREEVRRWAQAPLLGPGGRRTWVVELETTCGRSAKGEAAWLPRTGAEPCVPDLVAAWAWGWLGRTLPSAEAPTGLPAPVAWALTTALADLEGAWRPPAQLEENGLLSASEGTPEAVAEAWSRRIAARPEVRTWKVKVGRASLEDDLARLRALRLPPGTRLRLDPNRGWGAHDPATVWRALDGLPIEYVEEPVAWPRLGDWARAGVPCAADESITVDLALLAQAGLRALVLKPSVIGDLGAVLRLIESAEREGLTVVLSSSLEGPVGRRHLEALTTRLTRPSPAGLARDALLEPPESREHAAWSHDTDPLARAAAEHGDAVALETSDTTLTFAAWHHAAAERAAVLGRRSGERLAVEIDGPEGAIELLAILRSGAVACLVPPGVQQQPAMDQVGATWPSAGTGEPPGIDLGQPATLLWSSGSRGAPRAIAHSLGQHLSSAAASHTHTPFSVGDRWIASLRMHHVGGLALLFRALSAGGTVVFPGDRPLEALAPTHLSWVPTQLVRAPDAPPPTLRHVLIGGAAAPPELIRQRRALGWPVKTTYGSTELASQACTSTVDADPRCSGAALACRVVEALPAIRAWGPTVCLGVWSDGALQPLTDADGWLPTGDVGTLDDDGTLRVLGRADTMFISGGENVFPETIERALCAHPAVRSVVVVDVPDPLWGARPWAFVEGDLTLAAALDHLRERLPRHAWVDRVLPWEPEGVGSTGKPRRAWFRERAHALSRGDA